MPRARRPPKRADQLAAAVRYLSCSPLADQPAVAAARLLLSDFAPTTRSLVPLRRAQALLQPHAQDREVQAALSCLAELCRTAPQGG